MRRMLFVLLALSMVMLLAVPSGAAKPQCNPDLPGYTPGHPACQDSDDPDPLQPCPAEFTLSGTGGIGLECDWEPEFVDGDVDGVVTVTDTGTGEVSRLVVAVRDSSPGDYCPLTADPDPGVNDYPWYEAPFDTNPLTLTFDLTSAEDSYWEGKTNWCGNRYDSNGDPLHLLVTARTKKGGSITVTLYPAPVEPPG